MFDFHSYLRGIVGANRLAQQVGFYCGTCTGVDGVEEVLAQFSTTPAFVLSDDVSSGETVMSSGGWFRRRTMTVFVLHAYRYEDELARQHALGVCRELSRQLQSRLVRDQAGLQSDFTYLRLETMPTTEIGRYFSSGMTGLYFMLNIDEPTNLSYESSAWID